MSELKVADVVNFRLALTFVEREGLTVEDLGFIWPRLLACLLLVAVLAEKLLGFMGHEVSVSEDLATKSLPAVEVLTKELRAVFKHLI